MSNPANISFNLDSMFERAPASRFPPSVSLRISGSSCSITCRPLTKLPICFACSLSPRPAVTLSTTEDSSSLVYAAIFSRTLTF